MHVIPVIDLKSGVVVRGIAGERDRYQPVQSQLGCAPTPASVAHALHALTNCGTMYVADLDAIAGAQPNWQAYEEIAACGAKLMVDAGIANVERAVEMVRSAETAPYVEHLIIGLESMDGPELASEFFDLTGERGVFSLDLQRGKPLTRVPAWQSLSPVALAEMMWRRGCRQMIVLDLASVGVDEGVATLTVCAQIAEQFPEVELISGGGVRNQEDLDRMASAGCSGALVASALHAKALRF